MQTKWTQSLTYELQKSWLWGHTEHLGGGGKRVSGSLRPAYAKYNFQASQGYIQTVSKQKPNNDKKKKKLLETTRELEDLTHWNS